MVAYHHYLRYHCPGCSWRSLQVAEFESGGRILCNNPDCPNPSMLDDILREPEQHIAFIDDSTVSVRHPLHERPGTGLRDCAILDSLIARGNAGELEPGQYFVNEDLTLSPWEDK